MERRKGLARCKQVPVHKALICHKLGSELKNKRKREAQRAVDEKNIANIEGYEQVQLTSMHHEAEQVTSAQFFPDRLYLIAVPVIKPGGHVVCGRSLRYKRFHVYSFGLVNVTHFFLAPEITGILLGILDQRFCLPWLSSLQSKLSL
jgi:hypothetical protein